MLEFQGRDYLIATSVKHHGDWDKIYQDMHVPSSMTYEEAAELIKSVKSRVVTALDDDYPSEILKACPKPPFVLYYYGDISLAQDHKRIVTVVGSRKPTSYAVEKTRSICAEVINKGYIVASGLARGIDTIAAEATIDTPGRTIAVLGCGIDVVYPPENTLLRDRIASTGLLLSEYPNSEPPYPYRFPARNRILASISKGTFIGEAGPHSGTLITAAFAMEVNHDVAALPFRCDEGFVNNSLIKNGAALVETAEDLVDFLTSTTHYYGK